MIQTLKKFTTSSLYYFLLFGILFFNINLCTAMETSHKEEEERGKQRAPRLVNTVPLPQTQDQLRRRAKKKQKADRRVAEEEEAKKDGICLRIDTLYDFSTTKMASNKKSGGGLDFALKSGDVIAEYLNYYIRGKNLPTATNCVPWALNILVPELKKFDKRAIRVSQCLATELKNVIKETSPTYSSLVVEGFLLRVEKIYTLHSSLVIAALVYLIEEDDESSESVDTSDLEKIVDILKRIDESIEDRVLKVLTYFERTKRKKSLYWMLANRRSAPLVDYIRGAEELDIPQMRDELLHCLPMVAEALSALVRSTAAEKRAIRVEEEESIKKAIQDLTNVIKIIKSVEKSKKNRDRMPPIPQGIKKEAEENQETVKNTTGGGGGKKINDDSQVVDRVEGEGGLDGMQERLTAELDTLEKEKVHLIEENKGYAIEIDRVLKRMHTIASLDSSVLAHYALKETLLDTIDTTFLGQCKELGMPTAVVDIETERCISYCTKFSGAIGGLNAIIPVENQKVLSNSFLMTVVLSNIQLLKFRVTGEGISNLMPNFPVSLLPECVCNMNFSLEGNFSRKDIQNFSIYVRTLLIISSCHVKFSFFNHFLEEELTDFDQRGEINKEMQRYIKTGKWEEGSIFAL